MKIAIGSINPVKVTAVTTTCRRLWPEATIIPVAVPSGVGEMPLTDAETRLGAHNRAQAARDLLQADYGIGLEGGAQPEPFGLVLQGWVVVLDTHGRQGIGGCPRLQLPPAIARRVQQGEELGAIMDEVMGDHNTKQKDGAVGALTCRLVLREDAFATAVAYALAPFVRPGLYGDRVTG